MQVLSFHEDDLYAFKQLGWVGENNEGLLTSFELNRNNLPEDINPDLKELAKGYKEDEFNAVVAQINEARTVVMRRVIETNENLTESDLPSVYKIFGRLNAENAWSGEKIQMEDGSWITKTD